MADLQSTPKVVLRVSSLKLKVAWVDMKYDFWASNYENMYEIEEKLLYSLFRVSGGHMSSLGELASCANSHFTSNGIMVQTSPSRILSPSNTLTSYPKML